jgi:hypothetical protein
VFVGGFGQGVNDLGEGGFVQGRQPALHKRSAIQRTAASQPGSLLLTTAILGLVLQAPLLAYHLGDARGGPGHFPHSGSGVDQAQQNILGRHGVGVVQARDGLADLPGVSRRQLAVCQQFPGSFKAWQVTG